MACGGFEWGGGGSGRGGSGIMDACGGHFGRGGMDDHGRLAREVWQMTAFGRHGSGGRSAQRLARRVEARPVVAEIGMARGGVASGGRPAWRDEARPAMDEASLAR
uniref:Uncharacterized protein n=1 Tax=Oryza barthii TaxID=65489 RepID=A0A0D3H3M1_9ORYZ